MERSRIKKLGSILHFTDLDNAIIKDPQKLPKIGADVVTEELVHIGKVIDIFGPLKSPYVSVKIKKEYKDSVTLGTKLFAIERLSYFDKRKAKKKKIPAKTFRYKKRRSRNKTPKKK